MPLTIEDSPRLVLCAACGSEGCSRLLDSEDGVCGCHYYGRNGALFNDCPHACPYCNGTGGALIATEPVELDGLTPLVPA